jgi:Leucine-rich repeat (LRR) protein
MRKVSGTIIDKSTGLPLKGVAVFETGKDWHQIITNDSGHFEISSIAGGLHRCPPMHIRFQKENYTTIEKEIEGGEVVTIALEPALSAISTAIINDTAYLTTTRQLQRNKIPDSVFMMKNLKHLSISGMDCDYGDHTHCWGISEIPSQIGQLTQLETLSLTLNGISSLPATMSALTRLRMLDLTDNLNLEQADMITALTNLETLYLFGCRIKKLPANIGVLKNLKHLGLTGNPVDAEELKRLKKELPHCEIIFAH